MTQPALDLKALGCYSNEDISASAHARVLLVGKPKAGKTCALMTAPSPLLINCDSKNAARGAAVHVKNKFEVINCSTISTWEKALQVAEKGVQAGVFKSIVVDTVTLLCDNILDNLKVKGFKNFELWNELDSIVRGGIKKLNTLNAHLFVSAHMPQSHDGPEGALALIPGQMKEKIPALLDDAILMLAEPGKKPDRVFVLGPQPGWNGGGRNVRRDCVIEASIPALFEEFGIKGE